MRIAMSGATGFVGGHLTRGFESKGWTVIPLRRDDFQSDDGLAKKCEGADIIINLAGAPVAARWTEEYKKTLYQSRLGPTMALVRVMGRLSQRPNAFISTSAIGIYSTNVARTHDEVDCEYADDFLGRLAQEWEKEALAAKNSGVRTLIFRFGVVLGRSGGALEKMLTPFKLGLGGIIGDGTQPFSWIHIDDLIEVYIRAIEDETMSGVFNLTSPEPTTNAGLTRALGKALRRPTVMKVPAFVLRLQLGEGAQVVTKGQRVIPKRLLGLGYRFRYHSIDEAIRDLVG